MPIKKNSSIEIDQDETFRHLRNQISRYCHGRKDALGTRALACLRAIFFYQGSLAKTSRFVRYQSENICDLYDEDYELLKTQNVIKVDVYGNVIEPKSIRQCSKFQRELDTTDVVHGALQHIISVPTLVRGFTSFLLNPVSLLLDPGKASFVVSMIFNLTIMIAWDNAFITMAFFAMSIAPMYRMDRSCNDYHNINPVPARFRLLGHLFSFFIFGGVFAFLVCMGLGVPSMLVLLSAIHLSFGSLGRQTFQVYQSFLQHAITGESSLSPTQAIETFFVEAMDFLCDQILKVKADGVRPHLDSATDFFKDKILNIQTFLQEYGSIKTSPVQPPQPTTCSIPAFMFGMRDTCHVPPPPASALPGILSRLDPFHNMLRKWSESLVKILREYIPELFTKWEDMSNRFLKGYNVGIFSAKQNDLLWKESQELIQPSALTNVMLQQALSVMLQSWSCDAAKEMYNYHIIARHDFRDYR